jgi:hypothetical protein
MVYERMGPVLGFQGQRPWETGIKHLAKILVYIVPWCATALFPHRAPSHGLTLGSSQCPFSGQVLRESDLDNDNMLSFSEFEHAMAKSPDFMK